MDDVDGSTPADRLRRLIGPAMPARTPAEKFAGAMDLFDLGCELHRAKLRGEHPGRSAEEIERLLDAWLQERPGAEHGDAAGRVVPWPRGDGG
jgi:hypothetical protein